MKRYHTWNTFWLSLFLLFSIFICFISIPIGILSTGIALFLLFAENRAEAQAVEDERTITEEKIKRNTEKAIADAEKRRRINSIMEEVNEEHERQVKSITEANKEYVKLKKQMYDIIKNR